MPGPRGCPWLCARCPAPRVPGRWRSRTWFQRLGVRGGCARSARPRRCASERHCRPALPHRRRLFLALFIISPPSARNENEALAAGTSPRPRGSAGGAGLAGAARPPRRGGVRGGCGAGSALTLSRQGMLRGALGSAIGCPGRLRDYLWCAGRGSALAPLPVPMYHAMVDFSEKYLER